MMPDDTRCKIENIVAGNVVEGKDDHCKAIRNFLCRCFAISTTVKKDFEGKSLHKKAALCGAAYVILINAFNFSCYQTALKAL